MPKKNRPNYTELVYEIMRASPKPLTFDELFTAVEARHKIATTNPKSTIRNVLNTGPQFVSLGNSKYGYLPYLLNGSVLRLPLPALDESDRPLLFPIELRLALWPSAYESQNRQDARPVSLRLPNGNAIMLRGQYFDWEAYGTPLTEGLAEYLHEQQASKGDALVIRITDAEAGQVEAVFEPRDERDDATVMARNQVLTDAAADLLRTGQARMRPALEFVIPLLGRGYYHDPIPPDPLDQLLEDDERFVTTGYGTWMLAERMTAEDRMAFETFPDFEELPFPLFGPASLEGSPAEFSLAGLPPELEQSLNELSVALAAHGVTSIDDVNALLQEMVDSGALTQPVETPLDRAQEFVYQAWEAPTPHKAARLAKRALKESPDCADAYVVLAEATARTAKQAADLYAQGVAAGERALGPQAFADLVGNFWGFIETRPYMRARFGLAEALAAQGQKAEAAEHLWDMLRLNPGDNQGVRYPLLFWLLELGDDAAASQLLQRYPEDGSAHWFYGRVLHSLRTSRSHRSAEKLLKKAVEWNPYVPAYLTGGKRLPLDPLPYIGMGDVNEAIDCVMGMAGAWKATPGAIEWLAEHTA